MGFPFPLGIPFPWSSLVESAYSIITSHGIDFAIFKHVGFSALVLSVGTFPLFPHARLSQYFAYVIAAATAKILHFGK